MIKILINPFEKYSEKHLISFGVLSLIIGSYFGYLLNVNFDSILHLSYVENTFPTKSFIQNTLILLTLTTTLYVLGKYHNKKTRLIDIFAISLISRIPFYFLTLININDENKILTDKLIENLNHTKKLTFSTYEIIFLFTSSLIGIIILIWFGILIWNGFKTATNSKKPKEIILFIIALFIANLISLHLIKTIN